MDRLIPRTIFLALAVLLAGTLSTLCQSQADDSDLQSWNEVSVTKRIHKKADIVIPFTFRVGKNITRLNEGRVGVSFVLKPHKAISISPGYLYLRVRNSAGEFANENRFLLGATFRSAIKTVGLAHRSLFEYRVRSRGNSWRYRPSVTVDKKLPEKWTKGAKLFVTEEPFYDSAAGRFSRNRLSFGINKAVSEKLSVDLYYLRQDDRNSTPGVLHVIGTGWKVKL